MRVFMLGWEFPPFISGGLGTACHGLTRALSRSNVAVTFVLPRNAESDEHTHVRLLGANSLREAVIHTSKNLGGIDSEPQDWANVTFKTVPAGLLSPYQSAGGSITNLGVGQTAAIGDADIPAGVLHDSPPDSTTAGYRGDLIAESHRYSRVCVELARGEDFDVVHAHDWLTFPAGVAVAAAYRKPLVVHVHSTEFDRSGEEINQQVYDIERHGMHSATRVVAVSYLTATIIRYRYGVDPGRINVIYNGIESGTGNGRPRADLEPPSSGIRRTDRIVLYLGRITMQKGPEYFIMAAKKVLRKIDNVKFVMAGTGDMIRNVIELAAREGIGHRVLFTGFLRGDDVSRIYRMADVYVMPSVSEPFGIAPLEAIRHDVPVIISKTSGVAEVLTHALKVDFWDTDDIAEKIIAVLRHPPLSTTLRDHADFEVRRLTWKGAAEKCLSVYEQVAAMSSSVPTI